jgi:hypothetical protein
MSESGHLRRFDRGSAKSGLPAIADVRTSAEFRRYGPKPDVRLQIAASNDPLIVTTRLAFLFTKVSFTL